MPKVTKAKREKNADFKKAKLKLGKGKKVPSNATDTSFKARSIALPGQQNLNRALAALESSGTPAEPTTSQGLNLDEVLIRFRHPNAGVRKDSLGGLKEIVSGRPDRGVGKVLRGLGGMISDDDAGVRTTLLGFLGWYIPALTPDTLSPHLPLLLLQTSSALSHIFPEIRIDACKLVHLLLQHVPKYVVGSWPNQSSEASSSKTTLDGTSGGGSTILEGLRLAVGLGGEKGTNAAMGRLGNGGKLVTLRTLLAFVGAALGPDGGAVDSEVMFEGWKADSGSGFRNKGKERMAEGSATVESMLEEGWLIEGSDWGLAGEKRDEWEMGGIRGGRGGDEHQDGDVLAQLYLQLAPLLLSTFLESAPTAFSPSSFTAMPSTANSSVEDVSVALCSVTASLTEILAKSIISRNIDPSSSVDQVRTSTSDFLRRMAAWFPFRSPAFISSATSSSGLSPAFSLSLSYANLAILLAPRVPTLVFPKGIRRDIGWKGRIKVIEEAWKVMRKQGRVAKGKGKAGGADEWALEEVAAWAVDSLAPSKDILTPQITSTAYSALLPVIFSLLVLPPPAAGGNRNSTSDQTQDTPSDVGSAFLNHLSRQSSSSTIRSHGEAFLISLVEIHEQRHPQLPFFIPVNSPLRPLIRFWLENLPKTLWELGSRDEKATERLLRLLLELGLRGEKAYERPYSLIDSSTFLQMSQKLATFYFLVHPTKGAVPGPWTRLVDIKVKKLGEDLGKVWMEWDDEGKLKDAIERAQGSSS